jgi:hypothetical protein
VCWFERKELSSAESEAAALAEGRDKVRWDETTGEEDEDEEGDVKPEGRDPEEEVEDAEDGVEVEIEKGVSTEEF